jgi:terminase large subunit-like protein
VADLAEQLRRLQEAISAGQVSETDAAGLFKQITGHIKAECAKDGLFWLKFVQTRDEADPDHSLKAFPVDLEYVRGLWGVLAENQAVVIAKSRQMLVSWELAAYCVWHARSKPNQAVYWQTKAWEDAVAMVCMPSGGFQGRCQFIEDNLPAWMKMQYKPSEGRVQYPNGSVIQALSGGADKVRGKVVSVLVEDEFAFQDDQEGVYTAVSPLIQKGSKVFFVSTPNGSGNTFATIFHGRPVGQERV